MALMTRRDVLIVASVSCIYGLGSPEQYEKYHLMLSEGQDVELDAVIRRLVDLQYERNELNFIRGKFRVRGDTLEIFPSDGETAWRLEFFGDTIDRITRLEPITGELIGEFERVNIFPNSHYITGGERLQVAIGTIEAELAERLGELDGQNKLLEAQRLRMRTNYDLEMLREIGICSGIENYSRHLDGRSPGETPYTLMDYFPDDFMIITDESHVTIPQVGGDVRGRPIAEVHPDRPRVPPSQRTGQQAAQVRGVPRQGRPDHPRVRDARALREARVRDHRRTGHPPHGTDRPRGGPAADQGPDRRSDNRDPRTRRAGPTGPRHHAHQEDERGPYRLPCSRPV